MVNIYYFLVILKLIYKSYWFNIFDHYTLVWSNDKNTYHLHNIFYFYFLYSVKYLINMYCSIGTSTIEYYLLI